MVSQLDTEGGEGEGLRKGQTQHVVRIIPILGLDILAAGLGELVLEPEPVVFHYLFPAVAILILVEDEQDLFDGVALDADHRCGPWRLEVGEGRVSSYRLRETKGLGQVEAKEH